MEYTKRCGKCEAIKPLDDFNRSSHHKMGRQDRCRDCEAIYREEHIERRRVRDREYHIRSSYGISRQQYLEMVSGGCCLCGVKESASEKFWHVDHDHNTGEVRGLLCRECNTALGIYQKFISRVGESVINRYLKRQE